MRLCLIFLDFTSLSLLLFCSVCETSPNFNVYTLLPLQTANRMHHTQVEQIEAKVERLLLLKKEKEGKEEDRQHYH
jgi:hypothetical protein